MTFRCKWGLYLPSSRSSALAILHVKSPAASQHPRAGWNDLRKSAVEETLEDWPRPDAFYLCQNVCNISMITSWGIMSIQAMSESDIPEFSMWEVIVTHTQVWSQLEDTILQHFTSSILQKPNSDAFSPNWPTKSPSPSCDWKPFQMKSFPNYWAKLLPPSSGWRTDQRSKCGASVVKSKYPAFDWRNLLIPSSWGW